MARTSMRHVTHTNEAYHTRLPSRHTYNRVMAHIYYRNESAHMYLSVSFFFSLPPSISLSLARAFSVLLRNGMHWWNFDARFVFKHIHTHTHTHKHTNTCTAEPEHNELWLGWYVCSLVFSIFGFCQRWFTKILKKWANIQVKDLIRGKCDNVWHIIFTT